MAMTMNTPTQLVIRDNDKSKGHPRSHQRLVTSLRDPSTQISGTAFPQGMGLANSVCDTPGDAPPVPDQPSSPHYFGKNPSVPTPPPIPDFSH